MADLDLRLKAKGILPSSSARLGLGTDNADGVHVSKGKGVMMKVRAGVVNFACMHIHVMCYGLLVSTARINVHVRTGSYVHISTSFTSNEKFMYKYDVHAKS